MIQRYPFHGGVTYVDDEAGLTSVGYYPAYETELIARKYGSFRSLVDDLGLWPELHNMKKEKDNLPLFVCVQKGFMPKNVYEKFVEEIRSSLKDIYPDRKIFIHSEQVKIYVVPPF